MWERQKTRVLLLTAVPLAELARSSADIADGKADFEDDALATLFSFVVAMLSFFARNLSFSSSFLFNFDTLRSSRSFSTSL